ncbi:MAG: hypothetical protein ACT4N2_16455 [Hyphomicrobium sp.]
MPWDSTVTENEVVGYTVAYDQEELTFPVYVVAFLAAVCFAAAAVATQWNLLWLACGLAGLVVVYWNFPLIETGRPRLGAGQYGFFLEALGLVPWQAITRIEMVANYSRGVASHELQVTLRRPVEEVLILDWRKRPFYRWGMRLPWSMKGSTLIRVPLDILAGPNADIHQRLLRMWRFYRGE